MTHCGNEECQPCAKCLETMAKAQAEIERLTKVLDNWKAVGDAIMVAATGKPGPLSDSDVVGEIERLKSELDAANQRFAEMNTPTGREIELQAIVDAVRSEAGFGRVFDDYVATIPIVTEFCKHGSLEARVQALRDDRDRLQGIVSNLHRTCGNEMSDNTQGPSETCCKMWARIEESAEKARHP